MKRQTKQWLTTVSAVPGEGADGAMFVTTQSPDRVGDRIVTAGLDVANYLKNPTMLWTHQHQIPPIGSVVALEKGTDRIRAAWKWSPDEFAQRIKLGWDGGHIRAASIGFRPLEEERNEFGGYDFIQSELLEISLCAVPCNQEAVRQLKALDLWPGASGRENDARDLRSARASLRAFAKQGRVLSSYTERLIREAAERLDDALAQLDAGDEGKSRRHARADQEVLIDGEPITSDALDEALAHVTPEEVAEIVGRVVGDELMRVTGIVAARNSGRRVSRYP